MTKNHSPDPVPSDERPSKDELPEQDESGKTAAPKSAVGHQEQDDKRRPDGSTDTGAPAQKH